MRACLQYRTRHVVCHYITRDCHCIMRDSIEAISEINRELLRRREAL